MELTIDEKIKFATAVLEYNRVLIEADKLSDVVVILDFYDYVIKAK